MEARPDEKVASLKKYEFNVDLYVRKGDKYRGKTHLTRVNAMIEPTSLRNTQ